MSFKIEMPHVGESVTEAVIGKWLKAEGDHIDKYDPIVEVVTDKVAMEVPAPASGILLKIVATEGETVQMGAVIAEMDSEEGEVTSTASETAPTSDRPDPGRIGELITGANVGPTGGAFTDTSLASPSLSQPSRPFGPQQQPGESGGPRYSPVVARLASEHGIDLSTVTGTGLGGRVTKKDVEAVIGDGQAATTAATPPASGEDRIEAPSAIRRMIADHMVKSWREIPHAWSAIEVDATGMAQCRQANRDRLKDELGVDLTYLPLALHAVAAALKDHELINSSWEDGRIRIHNDVHVGIAVAAPNGLVVPVVRNADQQGVLGLATALSAVVDRARSGKLAIEDVQGGTFTLNNTGALGSVWGGAIINHPQAAILTTEAIVKRAVVVESPEGDSVAIRPMMNICLSFDHRIIDGAEASAFLQDVRRRMESFGPETDLG